MFNKKKSRKEGTRSGKRPDEVIRIGDSGLEIASGLSVVFLVLRFTGDPLAP